MGLKEKASKIDFGNLGGVPAPAQSSDKQTKTAPGELMAFANQQRSKLLQENEELKARAEQADALQRTLDETILELRHWDGAKAARLLDPDLVVRSRWANRHELNFSSPDFIDLRDEIRNAGGNIQPIKVRPLSDGRYEIVFGHRRHEACRLEGLPVLAMIDNLDEKSLFVEMDRENRARKNLSAYEQGVMYRNALKAGLFPNQRSLAESTGADASLVTKALYLADLPIEVVEAFPSVLDIQFRFAKPLRDAVESNAKAVLSAAKNLKKLTPRPDVKAVFDALVAAGSTKKMEPFHFPEPIAFERDGKSVGSLSVGKKGMSLNLSNGSFSDEDVEQVRALVEQILAKQK